MFWFLVYLYVVCVCVTPGRLSALSSEKKKFAIHGVCVAKVLLCHCHSGEWRLVRALYDRFQLRGLGELFLHCLFSWENKKPVLVKKTWKNTRNLKYIWYVTWVPKLGILVCACSWVIHRYLLKGTRNNISPVCQHSHNMHFF